MPGPLPDEKDVTLEYAPLLDRARNRDRDAFARLYDATYRRVFGYLLARVGEQPAAEDLLQEVYVAALQAITRFAVTRRRSSSVGFSRSRTRRSSTGSGLSTAIARSRSATCRQPIELTRSKPSIGAPSFRAVAAALSELTEEQKEVIVNRLVLGLDLEETSKVMRKNVGSIKALQHRALARLARILSSGGTQDA